MIPRAQFLHEEMLAAICKCQHSSLPDKEKAESCFWICREHWEKLKVKVSPLKFSNLKAEIYFFKVVKPQFTSFIEYYVLLSEALLFIPAKRDTEFNFWEEEAKRFERFCDRNREFIRYYESGSEDKDACYFSREKCGQIVPVVMSYDNDTEFLTPGDPLLRSYIAQQRYFDYAMKKIASF